MNPKELTIRRIMDDASILQVFGDKSATAENSPLQKYWETMYKREGEESRLPYAGEEKIEKVLEFLKPRYMSQGELGIKDSKEWEIYKNQMGKNEFGELRSPEKPERIQSSYDRDVRYEMNRMKRHPDEPIMLFDDRENRIARYERDRKAYSEFMENISNKSFIYDMLINRGDDQGSMRHYWQHEDIRDLKK